MKKTVADYQEELDRIHVSWRWGDARRFHSNHRKIARINWLMEKIADLTAEGLKEATKSNPRAPWRMLGFNGDQKNLSLSLVKEWVLYGKTMPRGAGQEVAKKNNSNFFLLPVA